MGRVRSQDHRPLIERRPARHPAPPDRRARDPVPRGGRRDHRGGRGHRRGDHRAGPGRPRRPGAGVIRVQVPLPGRAYDVWVGAGAADRLADVLPEGARRVALVTQAGVPDLVSRGPPGRPLRGRRRRAPQDAGHGRGAVPRLRPRRSHPGGLRRRRGRRPGHRRRGLRRRDLPPGHRGHPRPDHVARDDRRRHRGQDRREPAGGQEPGRRVLAAGRRAVRPRRPRHPARAGVPQRPRRDGQVPLPHRGRPARPPDGGAGGGVRRHQGRGGERRRAGGPGRHRRHRAGRPQLRPHPRATHWRSTGTTTCATARRSPSASSTRRSWPPSSAASTRPASTTTGGSSTPTASPRCCRPARTPTGWWR